MISLPLSVAGNILGVEQTLPDECFKGVTTDSRDLCQGKLFFALSGENFDGHEFVDSAWKRGAVAAVVTRPVESGILQLQVDDCIQAMARLALDWRRRCNPCVIALTGSNGKTTVKEMLTRILSGTAVTHATRGNFNNEIGVPLTLFDLTEDHHYAVIEMGANHRGEIARLTKIAEPDVVYINNAAAAHLAGFGDIEGVIEAKGEIYDYCKAEHRALFNVDEAAAAYWRSRCAAQTQLTCSLDGHADLTADWQACAGGIEGEFAYDDEVFSAGLRVMGEHNARNALAAVGLAVLAGVKFRDAVSHLEGFRGVKGRLQSIVGPSRSRLIDDSYNANPGSLMAGVKVLCALDGSAWLALGDMGELGEDAAEFHRQCAKSARDMGVERLFGIGEMSCLASREFGETGYCYTSIDAMAEAILGQIHPEVNLLVKGSRAIGMEQLVERLAGARDAGEANVI